MNNRTRGWVVVGLAGMVAAVVAVKNRPHDPMEPGASVAVPAVDALPRLVDLGAGKCIPCKQMAPILDALKEEFSGIFAVDFIDVWENPEAAEPYRIRLIPTQIFFDASGNEVFRHEGFFGREEILATWRAHGVACGPPP